MRPFHVRNAMSTSVFWVLFLLSAAPPLRTHYEDVCLRQFRIFTSSFELTRNVLVPELSIFGSPSTCGLGWQKSKSSSLFTGSWIANHCGRVISIDLRKGTPPLAFLRRPCIYYFNTTATFCPLLLGDLVFKLNPGPAHTSSRLNGLKQNIQRSRSTRNAENLTTPARVRLYPSDQQLTLCPLNARSLNNKSAAFLELVCDVRADLFIICETWLKDHHSAVLSKLTPTRI